MAGDRGALRRSGVTRCSGRISSKGWGLAERESGACAPTFARAFAQGSAAEDDCAIPSPTAVARQLSRTGRGPSDQPDCESYVPPSAETPRNTVHGINRMNHVCWDAVFRELVGTAPGVENNKPLPRAYSAQSKLVRLAPSAPTGSRQEWQRTFFGMPDMTTITSGDTTPRILTRRARARGAVNQPWSHQTYGQRNGQGGWWPRMQDG